MTDFLIYWCIAVVGGTVGVSTLFLLGYAIAGSIMKKVSLLDAIPPKFVTVYTFIVGAGLTVLMLAFLICSMIE